MDSTHGEHANFLISTLFDINGDGVCLTGTRRARFGRRDDRDWTKRPRALECQLEQIMEAILIAHPSYSFGVQGRLDMALSNQA